MKLRLFIFWKLYVLSILILFYSGSIWAQSYISEIDFGNIEFVEIYSNESLNLTNAKVLDENHNKFNTLELIQRKNSSFYLIVGQSFLASSNYNFSNLNCSIYVTDKSQVANGGLKSAGENLTISFNSSFNLSYFHLNDYIFDLNESLNYDFNYISYYISNRSICSINNFVPYDIFLNVSSNSSNNSLNKVLKNDSVYFKVKIKDFLVFDKVSFDFDTNVSNFTLKYWVEDYLGNVVKSPRETNNLNSKSWSPNDKSNIFFVKGILYFGNKSLNTSEMFYYYSNETYLNEVSNLVTSSDTNEKSSIMIKNKNDLVSQKTTILEYDIYKGNTLKRSVYFYLNGKKVQTLSIGKYSSLCGFLELKNSLVLGKNELVITGLDLEEDLVFEVNNVFSSNLEVIDDSNLNRNLYFENILINNSLIYFNLFSNLENGNINCYILEDKTKISNELVFNLEHKKYNLNLKIDDLKLLEKGFVDGNFLKLICKYNQTKTFKYLTYEFNYFFPLKNNLPIYNFNSNKLNFYSILENDDQNLNKNEFGEIDDLNFSSTLILKKENSSNKSIVIISKNLETKEISFKFLFVVLILLVCLLVVKW